ncbi:helix-turn-helix domain-containing protein [Streptomyces canus]|uniref:helix-turn-helix domain-containing protein n=1 Tax=Streptomyces canus TaxID=58343 RepID=UPI0003782816|nr:helix-turn-helix transcriptional regulator [Streptomyces canus]
MDNDLGDFLRARRELITPTEVGLPPGNNLRRVPGLRREEVAMLAGISAEYYIRLEQGRDRHPSAQVLRAIAVALQLDAEGTAYLMALGGPRPPRRPAWRKDQVPVGLLMLLPTLNVPAAVVDRYGEVRAANALARALSPMMAPGANWLKSLFTDPAAPVTQPNWERSTAVAVAHLRAQIGPETEDERVHALIGELSLKSVRFRQLWARHDVRTAHGGTLLLRHPRVGDMELLVEKFAALGTDGLEALFLHARPGTNSAVALSKLASLVAPDQEPNTGQLHG